MHLHVIIIKHIFISCIKITKYILNCIFIELFIFLYLILHEYKTIKICIRDKGQIKIRM